MTIATSAAILAIGIITAGCVQATATSLPPAAIRPTTISSGQSTASPATVAATHEALLEDMRLTTLWSIEESMTRGLTNLDYLYATLRTIEETQKALQELETQRQATQETVYGYIFGREEVPAFQYAVLESIEEARREVLARTGLVQ